MKQEHFAISLIRGLKPLEMREAIYKSDVDMLDSRIHRGFIHDLRRTLLTELFTSNGDLGLNQKPWAFLMLQFDLLYNRDCKTEDHHLEFPSLNSRQKREGLYKLAAECWEMQSNNPHISRHWLAGSYAPNQPWRDASILKMMAKDLLVCGEEFMQDDHETKMACLAKLKDFQTWAPHVDGEFISRMKRSPHLESFMTQTGVTADILIKAVGKTRHKSSETNLIYG